MLKTSVTKIPVLNSINIPEILIGILMTVHLYRFRGHQEFAIVDQGSLNLTCSVNILGHLSEDVIPSNQALDCVGSYDLSETRVPLVKKVNNLIEQYVDNIRKIALRFECNVEGEGIACCRNFKEMIQRQCLNRFEILDLSGLGIDLLPFHIGFFRKIKQLNLSNNQLRVLPLDLCKLESLEVIDLTGNPIVEIPDWLAENARLKILMDGPDNDRDDWAQDTYEGMYDPIDKLISG